ncbi:MAG: hypothetical protein J6X62_05720 [Bacteroidales bacterium]|nr:hypothetical protein [Bacteroidales bacterium]
MTETYNEHKPAFDDLAAAWQRECERLDRIAGKYPVGPSLIDACTKRQPLSRTLMRTALLRTLVCLAALAWLAGLYRRYVVDVWDLVPHLFIGGLLLYNIVYGLLVVVLLKRHGMAVPTPLLQHYLATAASRAAAQGATAGAYLTSACSGYAPPPSPPWPPSASSPTRPPTTAAPPRCPTPTCAAPSSVMSTKYLSTQPIPPPHESTANTQGRLCPVRDWGHAGLPPVAAHPPARAVQRAVPEVLHKQRHTRLVHQR